MFTRAYSRWRSVAVAQLSASISRSFATKSQLPEFVNITMPALSPTMTKGGLASWFKQVGDKISPGDKIAEIETDKATVDFEAQEEGFLAKKFIADGSTEIPVGEVLGIMVDDESDIKSFENYEGAESGDDDIESSPTEHQTSTSQLPAFQMLTMPALSPTMTKGSISEWLKKEGDEIKAGDVLAQVETDKATVDFESLEDGYLAKILVDANIPGIGVGDQIAVMVENQEDVAAFKDFSPDSTVPKPVKAQPSQAPKEPQKPSKRESVQKTANLEQVSSTGRIFCSPYAKKLAAENNLDIKLVKATGPNGRIVADDIMNFIKSSGAVTPSASQQTDQGNANAEHAALSKRTIPHYYLTSKVNADGIFDVIQSINANDPSISVSFPDFIVKAAAAALKDVPSVNSQWNGDSIRQYNYVDIGVQYLASDGRVTTSVVADADTKGLRQMSLAFNAECKPESEGTFTITNLGMAGASQVSAIVVPGQAAILALGQIEKSVMPAAIGTFKQSRVFLATLSCDHRIIDGAVGAQWLKAFKQYCENPLTLLL